ncbi:MAG: hypothetical protein COB30_000430 [Ectothiorhodospiraceae bacterium]|nr:hypothetical protein [Ectothiorhodospiraceae bacterium]
MKKPYIYVDFNEMVEQNLVLLSQEDTKVDSTGKLVSLYQGLEIVIYMDDLDESGSKDNLIAEGVVEKNIHEDWSAHVKWCCRIDRCGIQHESDKN